MKSRILLLGACAFISSVAAAQDSTAPTAPAVEAAVTQAADTMAAIALPAGTAVLFSIDNAMATDKREFKKGETKPPKDKRRITNAGDMFSATVMEDVKVGNHVVIPKGARGKGEVTMVTGRGGFGKSGKIEIKLNSLEVGEKAYAMDGTHLQKGRGRGGAAIAGAIIAGALVGILIKGEEADIPARAAVTFRTKDAIQFSAANAALAVEPTTAEVVAVEPATTAAPTT
jgi:hypothetical protein